MAKKKTTVKEKTAEIKTPAVKKAAPKKAAPKKAEPVVSEERYNQLNRVVVGRSLTTTEIVALFEREIGGTAKIEKPNVFQVSIVIKGIRFPKEGHYSCKQ